MYNDELFIGLKRIIETKDLKEIKKFTDAILHAYKIIDEDQENTELEVFDFDVDKYLDVIEEYFDNDDISCFEDLQEDNVEIDISDVAKQCFDVLYSSNDFYNLLADKINNLEYVEPDILNYCLKLSSSDFEQFCDVEEFEDIKKYKDELASNLKDAIYYKISKLSIDEFLKLNPSLMDTEYDEIIERKIQKMNEEEFYKYMIESGFDQDHRTEAIEARFKELDSPALYDLYSSLNSIHFTERGNKIEYLRELKDYAIYKVEETIKETEVVKETKYLHTDIVVPKWSKKDIKRLEESDEYNEFYDKLANLNNIEFTMYITRAVSDLEDVTIQKEKDLLIKKLHDLSDIDIEAAFCIAKDNCELTSCIIEELERRDLLEEFEYENDDVIDQEDEIDEYDDFYSEDMDFDEYEVPEIEEDDAYKGLSIKDKELAEERAKIYADIFSYDFCYRVTKPVPEFCSDKTNKEIENTEKSYISTICKLERCSDMECLKYINRLNQTENSNDYDCIDDEYNKYEKDDIDGEKYTYKDTPEDQKLHIYKQRCKYNIIQYLNKRLISMPKGYLTMIDISNENGVFNNIVEIGLENDIKNIELDAGDDEISL